MATKRKAEAECHVPAKSSRVEEVLTRGNNALMQLNELAIKGLQWSIEQMTNVFPQRFRASCLFTESYSGLCDVIKSGVSFYAEANNKAACRHEIATQIMTCLSGKKLNSTNSTSSIQVANKKGLIKTMNPAGLELIQKDDAVRYLNEKFSGIEYNFTPVDAGFCCHISFKGFMIKGNGPNKKVAKRNVAMQILTKHFKCTFPEEVIPTAVSVDSTTTMDIEKLPLNRRKNFSSQIQTLVKNEYDNLVCSLEIQYSKRKVLAGIVISRKLKVVFPEYYREQDESLTPNIIDPVQFFVKTGWTINPDDCGEILKLVTVSSGTKCLSGNDINSQGKTINDCHAEVISKRALQCFLYRTIHRMMNNSEIESTDALYGTDILEKYDPDDRWTYKVKDDVKFHLYVSSSPCGDSRIFFPQNTTIEESDDENEEDSHPNRKNRGVLRTKIECGEGTIPIKTKHIQTWDGILGGERLLTMSCSDKVCTWNVLGMQGALLSNILTHPVYLDTITIGSLFQLDHSQRALHERAKGVTEESDWSLRVSNSNQLVNDAADIDDDDDLAISTQNIDVFRVNGPWILTVTDQDEGGPGKASNFSANWILGEDGLEIVATAKGLRIDNGPSRLAKMSLFRSFLDVFKWTKVVCMGQQTSVEYSYMKTLHNYPDNAVGAVNYQRKKIALFKFFEQQNFGRWIGKPLEQDWFRLEVSCD